MRMVSVVVSVVMSAMCSNAVAAVLCQKRSGVIVVREACKKKEGPLDLAQFGAVGPIGAVGPKGDPGTDGSLRIFGNGSAGSHTTAVPFEQLEDPNRQYVDFAVPQGNTLIVGSGTVIRCTGTFTNNGTIVVAPGTAGGRFYFDSSPTLPIDAARRDADPGVAPAGAMSGELGDATRPRSGGAGAPAVSLTTARTLLAPGPKAGGGGAGADNTGGGSFAVIAASAVVNNGLINASAPQTGNSNGGGGGGGIVILASPGSIANNGTIQADGGLGGNSNSYGGVGGGGGGGIVHLLAPSVSNGGVVSVDGGAPGTPGASGSVAAVPRAGGGGGGACGGQGGQGGGVSPAGDPSAGYAGDPGVVVQTLTDPTALF